MAMVEEGGWKDESGATFLVPMIQLYLEGILLGTCSKWFAALVGDAGHSVGVTSRLHEDICTAGKV